MTADEQLRAAYERAVDQRSMPGREACVAPDALLALVRREGPEVARLKTLDHAMRCTTCRGEFELLRSIERAGGEGTREAVDHLRWKRHLTMALAASAAFALAVGPGRRLVERAGEAPVLRSPGGEGMVLVAPAETATLPAGVPARFTWHAVDGARSYTLELLASDGRVAASQVTSDTTAAVPPDAGLLPGEYHWTVRTRSDDGLERRSAARRLRIEP